MAPVAFVERRMAQHRVGGQLREGVGTKGVAASCPYLGVGVQGEAQSGDRGQLGVGLLGVQRFGAVDGAQQGSGAGRGVEHGTGGARERGHEGGGAGWSQRVLAGVGVQLAADEKLEGLSGTELGGEFGDAAQQRDRGAQRGGAGGVHSGDRTGRDIRSRGRGTGGGDVHRRGGRAEAPAEHRVEGGRQQFGEPLVGDGGRLQPDGGPVAYEQQGAAGMDQCGDGARGVGGKLLPHPFTERDFGKFPLVAQPLLDLGESEGRTGLGAADGLGEVGVATSPVADRGTSDPRQAGDAGSGHLARTVRHRPTPSSVTTVVPALVVPSSIPSTQTRDPFTLWTESSS